MSHETPMPTALIVEDEPEANKLLGMLIKLRGYRSTSAFNGRDALEQLGKGPPDVLFLDLMLPDVDGFSLCRAAKSVKQTCLVPVVVVSARIAEHNRLESFRAGADDFIAKPYLPDEIFEALRHAEGLREQAESDYIAGSARLGSFADDESARSLSRLKSLILGRTPLGEAEAGRLNELIERAEVEIGSWSSTHPTAPAPTLDYELTPERLVLDCRGIDWFEASGETFAAEVGRFDEAAVDRGEGRLTLVKRWA